MPDISRPELNMIGAALRDIRNTVEEIRRKAPEVGAFCDNIALVSQSALRIVEAAARQEN